MFIFVMLPFQTSKVFGFIRLSKNPLFRTIGWSGLFVLVAFIIEGFSTDTFALPYLWVSLGIVSAAGALLRISSEKI